MAREQQTQSRHRRRRRKDRSSYQEAPEARFFLIGNDFNVFGLVRESLQINLWLDTVGRSCFLSHKFDLALGKKHFSQVCLSEGAKRILQLPNAGGNSVASEVMSFEVLFRLFRARLESTEMEIQYYPAWSKITDYSIAVDDSVFGVSVTRAMKYRGVFLEEDAERLLRKKLTGVNDSSRNVINDFKWEKQVLHIWAEKEHNAKVLERVYNRLPQELKRDTLVLVTICNSEKPRWIFYGKNPTLEEIEMDDLE